MSDHIEVEDLIIHVIPRSNLSIGVKQDKDGDCIFLPLSQIKIEPPDALKGDTVTITMPEWLAIDKGLV